MRISDWSSDVCSSDLARRTPSFKRSTLSPRVRQDVPPLPEQRSLGELWSPGAQNRSAATSSTAHCRHNPAFPGSAAPRSEEHTSELQSLMRSSYAVFCLKKKMKIKKINIHNKSERRNNYI